MCDISQYAGLYSKTADLLRREEICPEQPGYELLRRAIVICKIDGIKDKKKFLKDIQKGLTIRHHNSVKPGLTLEEQWMLEAIRSRDIESSLYGFIRDLANQL